MTHPLQNLFNRLFSPMVETAVREKLNVRENENAFLIGARRYDENDRDRLEYDRAEVLESCLHAWRDNPLARRIVELTTQYAVDRFRYPLRPSVNATLYRRFLGPSTQPDGHPHDGDLRRTQPNRQPVFTDQHGPGGHVLPSDHPRQQHRHDHHRAK